MTVLGERFELLELLGRGGMAEVYRARDRRLGRDVAIKLLNAACSRDPGLLERFRQESSALAQLSHPSIVTLLDTGETDDGRFYLVMERLRGETLDAIFRGLRRRGETWSWQRLVRCVRQVCFALQAAHARQIIHRDIKPSNLFRLEDSPDDGDLIKILDFGIAKILAGFDPDEPSEQIRLTASGQFIGTPHYAAPEAIEPYEVGIIDGRVDIYALGVILYQGVAGTLPHEGQPRSAVLYKTAFEEPPPLRTRVPEVSSGIEAVVMRAMTRRPEDRYATVREFSEALAGVERESVQRKTQVFAGGLSGEVARALEKAAVEKRRGEGDGAKEPTAESESTVGRPRAERTERRRLGWSPAGLTTFAGEPGEPAGRESVAEGPGREAGQAGRGPAGRAADAAERALARGGARGEELGREAGQAGRGPAGRGGADAGERALARGGARGEEPGRRESSPAVSEARSGREAVAGGFAPVGAGMSGKGLEVGDAGMRPEVGDAGTSGRAGAVPEVSGDVPEVRGRATRLRAMLPESGTALTKAEKRGVVDIQPLPKQAAISGSIGGAEPTDPGRQPHNPPTGKERPSGPAALELETFAPRTPEPGPEEGPSSLGIVIVAAILIAIIAAAWWMMPAAPPRVSLDEGRAPGGKLATVELAGAGSEPPGEARAAREVPPAPVSQAGPGAKDLPGSAGATNAGAKEPGRESAGAEDRPEETETEGAQAEDGEDDAYEPPSVDPAASRRAREQVGKLLAEFQPVVDECAEKAVLLGLDTYALAVSVSAGPEQRPLNVTEVPRRRASKPLPKQAIRCALERLRKVQVAVAAPVQVRHEFLVR